MKLVIIDYGAGNIRSAHKAVLETGKTLDNFEVIVSNDPASIASADRIILPGDGSYPDCRSSLRNSGLETALNDAVIHRAVPFLGICVGMQLLSTYGLEYQRVEGLNWIEGHVERIPDHDQKLIIPHMGWNTLNAQIPDHPLLANIPCGDTGLHAFFLHSYHYVVSNPAHCIATTDYGQPLTAIIARNNIAGVQFHPEKSQKLGLTLLHNFLRWNP